MLSNKTHFFGEDSENTRFALKFSEFLTPFTVFSILYYSLWCGGLCEIWQCPFSTFALAFFSTTRERWGFFCLLTFNAQQECLTVSFYYHPHAHFCLNTSTVTLVTPKVSIFLTCCCQTGCSRKTHFFTQIWDSMFTTETFFNFIEDKGISNNSASVVVRALSSDKQKKVIHPFVCVVPRFKYDAH